MGKFPGKPSKIVNRKRIKVSKCCASRENESVKAAESIYYGLTVFNETFGNEQVTSDLEGFSSQETQLGFAQARQHLVEYEAICKSHGEAVSRVESFDRQVEEIIEYTNCEKEPPPPVRVSRRTRKQQCFDGGGGGGGGGAATERVIRRVRRISPSKKGGVRSRTTLQNSAAKKILQRAKKSSTFPLAAADNSQQDKAGVCGAIRKFVLPTRSAHSSRVIKPNKRFIEGDEVTSEVSAVRSSSAIQLKKPKLILSPLRNLKAFNVGHESFSFADSAGDSVARKSECAEETSRKAFVGGGSAIVSDSNDRTSGLSPPSQSPPDDSLIVEGKRRWKPSYKVQLKLRELNVFGAGTSRFPFKRNLGSSTDASESVNSSSDKETRSRSVSRTTDRSESEGVSSSSSSGDHAGVGNEWTGVNGSKVILRKARLKLNTHTSSSSEGPFSVSTGCGTSLLPGTVECGVCGAVRFYRFVKQARKFGIFSCESCRKFISKMIKRQACGKAGNLSPLDCHKGGGMCLVPPIVRSQQWKAGRGTLLRCSYKARCPACWLKMCLRSFNMPDELRLNLIAMLPEDMRSGLAPASAADEPPAAVHPKPLADTDFLSRGWHTKTTHGLFQQGVGDGAMSPKSKRKTVPKVGKSRTKHDERDLARNYHGSRMRQVQRSKIVRKLSKSLLSAKELNAESSCEEHPKKRRKGSGLKIRKKGDGNQSGLDGSRRQRLDLKGPRVKHVCRSASIVLGQPAATFPMADRPQSKSKQDTAKVPAKLPCCIDCKEPDVATKPQAADKNTFALATAEPSAEQAADGHESHAEPASNAEDSCGLQEDPALPCAPVASYRKANKLPSSARSLPIPGKQAAADLQNLVSIDFWESYDPEEVCNTGFGLIGSEPFHVRAICFLCGSGGSEQLIHCASCCEPYHRFCLEDGLRDVWRVNWTCQRCTMCHSCGRGQGQQLSCQRCHKTYHTECLGADRSSSRLHSPDRPWVCPTCLRCKSCGGVDVTVFVGNLPLCKACFKLRQKGNYCPLCQRCYEDHDYDTKMMECGKCSCWVHAKCEGLSDEKYQVLSFLPESVEFICRMCCVMPPAPWWIAVEEELKAGYLGVLKSLSKNRKACAMLKWSPKKPCVCRNGSVGKRLDFPDAPGSPKSVTGQENLKLPESASDKSAVKPPENAFLGYGDGTKQAEAALHKDGAQAIARENPASASQKMRNDVPCEERAGPKGGDPKADVRSNSSTVAPVPSANPEMPVPALEVVAATSELSAQKNSILKVCALESPHTNEVASKAANKMDLSMKMWREKYKIKECSVRIQDCIAKPAAKSLPPVKVEVPCPELLAESAFGDNGKSPGKASQASLATPCSDSGISSTDEEVKSCALPEEVTEMAAQERAFPASTRAMEPAEVDYSSSSNGEENVVSESEGASSEVSHDVRLNKECTCIRSKPSLTLLSIKKKVNASEYSSLLQFHQEMENLIGRAQCVDLQEMYHRTLQEVFPWFDPKYARVSSRPIHDDHFYASPCKLGLADSEKPNLDDSRTPNDSGKLDDRDQTVPNYLEGKSPDYYYSGLKVEDVRVCVLCKGVGDGLPTEEGRLLYCGQNEWTHTNCALWSAEVFEEIDGSLQNVQSAMSRGRLIRCPWCGKRGASVGCCARNCAETYHFPCARKARCTFMDDKNVFCPMHAADAVGKVLLLDSEFDIRRPIYVELDRKKKKFSEVQKVKFMIGSLLVESLGEFISEASDHPDIIIPVNFRCTRLFWSSVEPWRVVQYHVKTCYQVEKPKPALDLGKNVTVDHTQEQQVVRQKLEEVSRWHQELEYSHGKKESEVATTTTLASTPAVAESNKQKERQAAARHIYKKLPRKSEEDKVARQVVNYLLDTICNRDVEDSCLSDPQTAADILPPDLKDAIFEDLPHDLLDGISMQDIFPKLMSYEEPVVMDLKNDGFALKDGKEDLGEEAILGSDVDPISGVGRSHEAGLKGRRSEPPGMELVPQTDPWFQCADAKDQVQNIVEDLFQNVYLKGSTQKNGSNKELKRSKSEVIPQAVNKKVGGAVRGHQRSCSLTWSCKLEGSVGAQAKRRKISRTVARSSTEGASNVMSESTVDRAHMLQELRLPDGGLVTLARSSTPSIASTAPESVRELKYRLEEEAAAAAAQADLRRKVSHPKEEGKENKCLVWHGRSQPRLLQLDGTVDSSSSSSSSSEGGASPRQIDDEDVDGSFPAGAGAARKPSHGLVTKDETDEEPVKCARCHRTYRTRTSFERHLPTCSSDFILSTSESDSENTRSSEEEGGKRPHCPAVAAAVPAAAVPAVAVAVKNDVKPPTAAAAVKVAPVHSKVDNAGVQKKVPSSAVRNPCPQPRARAPAVNGRARGRPVSRGASQRNAVRSTAVNQSVPAQYHQQPQTSTAPTVIVQQVPSPSVVPAFVEAFQQQTGQSLQYIATIDAHNNGYNKHPFLASAPNSLVPGTFQLQASPDGFTGLQNGGIPVMPSVQLATSQPTVLGTIIQPPQPATIQCGMVTAEQMVLGSSPGLEMYTDQNGGMFLASQPMFIGLETVVSNTIMSSSQFVSAAMPGVVAASSSFSATTTQVFQASKLEPIMDVPSGFVIVNPHTPLSESLRNPEVITCTPPAPPPSVSISLPSAVPAQPPPVLAQPTVNAAPSAPWRYTVDNCAPSNADFGHFSPQMVSQVRQSNVHVEQGYKPPAMKSCAPLLNMESIAKTIPSDVCDRLTKCQLKVIKTTDVPNTSVSDVPVNALLPLQSVPKVQGHGPQSKANVPADARPVTVPVVHNRNNISSKPNSIKLVFQKQSQDGFYKISNQDHHGVKLTVGSKALPVPVQQMAVKCPKPKSRLINVTDKRKEDAGQYPPLVLQSSQSNGNIPNGGRHLQNGKVNACREKVAGKNSPTITYEIRSQDGFSCTSSSITEVWQKVFEAVQEARMIHKMPPLPQNPFGTAQDGLQMLGLKHNALRYLVEQLPGVGRCIRYKPRYHKLARPRPDEDVDALPRENATGCARSEPFCTRSPYDMFSWLASRHRQPPKFILPADGESVMSNRRATSSNLPMAMRFRHLKETSKEAVGVYRSHIHGRGLFCLRDIDAGEMVIEYAGEVIRSTLTDKREKLYESKGIGCYMFRIDDHLVVDATMRGNAARFINHSCEPNCYSRVVDILGKKHILIFALRRIPQGEELTYDYKFPFEDVKIPCTCGSRRCRKYLN